ncbi:TPA: DUF3270 domain-containing protein [Streptococcus suis]|nr:DUF3270 domain-containing protein [Streptococcus suis]
MALKQYQSQKYQYEDNIPKEKITQFQSYQVKNPNNERISELLFFVNIVLFSLITVISCYIYLSLDMPVLPAFLLASATGLVGLRLVQFGLRQNNKRLKNKIKK